MGAIDDASEARLVNEKSKAAPVCPNSPVSRR